MERKIQFVLEVSFDRPMASKRAQHLLEDAINRDVNNMGRDITRSDKPEARLIRARVLNLGRVLGAEMRRREENKDKDALVRIAAKRVRESMK